MSNMVLEVVARLKDEMSGTLGKMTANLQKFQEGWKKSFVQGVRSNLPEQLGFVGDALEKLPLGAMAAAGGIAKVGEVAVELALKVKDSALAFDALSTKTGASVEFLSGFSAAAGRTGIATDQVASAITKFSQTVYEAKGASADVEAELMKMADSFSHMADGPEKTAIAMKAFGDAGVALIPTLNQGSAAIKQLMTDAEAAGLVINSSTVAAAKNMDAAIDALNARVDALGARIGGAVLPVLANLAAGMDTAATKAENAGGPVNALNLFIAQLGPNAASAGAGLAMMGARANQAAALAMQAAQMAQVANNIMIAVAGGAAQVIAPVISPNAMAVAKNIGDVFDRSEAKWEKAGSAAAAQETRMRRLAQATSGTTREMNDYNDSQDEFTQITMESQRVTWEIKAAMDAHGGAAGGAAKKVEELKNAEDALKESIGNVKSMLSGSLQPMDELERVQTAYAIATGELSAEQFDQQQAVKALMQATKDKKITEEQALATALSLANGVAGTADAYAVAGDAGKAFADESAKVQGVAYEASKKVQEMYKAIKNLPPTASVDVAATIKGMGQVKELKTLSDYFDLHARHEIVFDVVYRTTGTPPPNGAGGGGTGGQEIPPPGSAPPGGGTGSTTPPSDYNDNPPPGGGNKTAGRGKGAGTSSSPLVILTMDGREVARAVAPYLKL